ncbi:RNA-binding domain-containing protein [Turicibacter sanguinis]|uniref:RNA-binding domain-containing protein n=1 Tax=Turicibacter sanguinis TaxID=154288 RepID=UPI0021D4AA49|nr:RNA-binding domain-containing protein [Turicibacter sanguinis]MCU7201205.1 putative DNA binding domain-containing protein [Turicibacter sanguinis]
MNELALFEILKIGEKVDIECKEASNQIPKSLWDTYSAMANTVGGIILLGIKEDRKNNTLEVVGVSNPNQRLTDFWNTVNDGKKVNINLLKDEDAKILEIQDKSIIAIQIPRANYRQKPIYVNENPFKGTYKRNHEGDYRCSVEEVKAMIRDSSDDGNDGAIIENYTIEDLDKKTLKQYRNRFASHNPDHLYNSYDDEEFLTMLGAIKYDRIRNKRELTAAGLLMFGKGHIIREIYPSLQLDYMEIMEDSVEIRWSDRFTIDGTWENNLYNFYFSVMPKLIQNIKVPFYMEQLERKDDTLVHKAIRESFINCMIHADYNIAGAIKVLRRKDRYEFHNLGNLKLDIEHIFKGGTSKSRNPNLQLMFRMIGLGENAGSGFPVILSAWDQQHWRKPELEENVDLNCVSLKLWMLSLIPDECLDALEKIYGTGFNLLNKDKVLALVTAYSEGYVTNARLQTISNNHSYDITKMLHELEEENYLIVEGYGKGKIYRINNDFLTDSYNIDLNDDEMQIITLTKKVGYVSNSTARKDLGFSKDKNITLFNSLLEKDILYKEGSGKKTIYKLK